MIFSSTAALVLGLFVRATYAQDCTSPSLLTCRPVSTTPTLDGDLSDWESVEGGIDTPIYGALAGKSANLYQHGNSMVKCLYDDSKIYFTMEVPGMYRFNATDNHQCATIALMFPVGVDAEFYNMGNCPQAAGGCDSSGAVPGECDDYRVDIGAHWELATTEQGVLYTVNNSTGNDDIGNKDDEYAASPFCRLDDDGTDAANEWEGAWVHTNSTEGAMGTYIFELSRSLTTLSPSTDAQFEAGNVYSFGVAFWDPFEIESGWTDHGHYVSGCADQWTDLWLARAGEVDPPTDAPAEAPVAAPPVNTPTVEDIPTDAPAPTSGSFSLGTNAFFVAAAIMSFFV